MVFCFAKVKQTNASSFWRSSHRISWCTNGKSYGLCYQWTSKRNAEKDILPMSRGGTRSQSQQDSPHFLGKYICSSHCATNKYLSVYYIRIFFPFLDIFRKWSDFGKCYPSFGVMPTPYGTEWRSTSQRNLWFWYCGSLIIIPFKTGCSAHYHSVHLLWLNPAVNFQLSERTSVRHYCLVQYEGVPCHQNRDYLLPDKHLPLN